MLHKMKMMTATVATAGIAALASASPASALNVGTIGTPIGSGTMALSATAGESRIVINGALPYNCTTSTTASLLATGAFALPATIGTTQFAFSSCVGPSGWTFTWTCVNTTSVGITTAPVGSVTGGRYTGISCAIQFNPLGCSATLSGSMPFSYTNPTLTTAGVATILTSGQSLTLSGSTCPAPVLPNGSVQYGAPVGAGTGLANLNYVFSGASSTHPFLS